MDSCEVLIVGGGPAGSSCAWRLRQAGLEALLTPEECLSSVEEAFRSYGEGHLAAPKSVGLHASAGTFHIKAALADILA